MLRAELRTRSRLPELQRWNEQVLVAGPAARRAADGQPGDARRATPPLNGPGTGDGADDRSPWSAMPPLALPAAVVTRASFVPRVARDLGTDAALAGGVAVTRFEVELHAKSRCGDRDGAAAAADRPCRSAAVGARPGPAAPDDRPAAVRRRLCYHRLAAGRPRRPARRPSACRRQRHRRRHPRRAGATSPTATGSNWPAPSRPSRSPSRRANWSAIRTFWHARTG